jgi:tetratricopeptide (TPR) repeat protein
MIQGFERLQKMLNANKPKGFVVGSAHYLDETHRTTELVSHYAGLRLIFSGWSAPRDPETGARIGGLDGIEQHYRELAERFGYSPSAEKDINSFGYAVLGDKKIDEALAAFRRNLELYPQSPNVYDSYADGLEAAGQNQSALENSRKAVELGTALGDPQLPDYQKHLDRLIAAAKPAVK